MPTRVLHRYFGIFDGVNVDSGVMIRYIERVGDKLYYRSGCGITHQSDMHSEYNEMNEKFMSLLVETIKLHDGCFINADLHEHRLNLARKLLFGKRKPLSLEAYLRSLDVPWKVYLNAELFMLKTSLIIRLLHISFAKYL